MNFELKSFDLAAAAAFKCDALLLLVADGFKPGKDPLSQFVQQAVKAGEIGRAHV